MLESLAKGPLQLTTVRGGAGCGGFVAPMERAAGGVSICCADSEPVTVMASPPTNAAPIDRPRIVCLDAMRGYSSSCGGPAKRNGQRTFSYVRSGPKAG